MNSLLEQTSACVSCKKEISKPIVKLWFVHLVGNRSFFHFDRGPGMFIAQTEKCFSLMRLKYIRGKT